MTASARLLLESAGDRLPSPSGVALAIMDLWQNERTTVQQLAQLVQTDPALCGRLLKLANSAAMGGRGVAAIPDAIVRVGMKTVGQLAVAFSLIDTHSDGFCRTFPYRDYWSHCLLMALLSRELAQATRLGPPQDLFACGLLARIGILAFATIYPDDYGRLIEEKPDDLSEAEHRRFGVDHNELSELLMLDYGVPRALAEPARFHETPEASEFDPDSRPAKLATLLHWSHRMAAITLESGQDRTRQAIVNKTLLAKLGLCEEAIGGIYDRASREWQEWSKLLDLPESEAPAYEDIANGESDLDAEITPSIKLAALVLEDEAKKTGLSNQLRELGVSATQCEDANAALRQAVVLKPQIFVLPADKEGLEFCRLTRSTEWGRSAYIFTVYTQIDQDLILAAFEAGSDAVIPANIGLKELEARLLAVRRVFGLEQAWRKDRAALRKIANELAISHRKQEVLSLTDQLTDLPNRRAAMIALAQAWSRSLRNGSPVGVVSVDVDHFKSINDRFGHAVGDHVLRQVAVVLRRGARQEETVARIGGEEFLLISPSGGIRELVIPAERLRRELAATRLEANGDSISLTVSLGVAERESSMASADELLNAADKALYAAKSSGRNKLCLYQAGKVRSLSTSA
ncbi:MAG: diguanylate cyclase [Gammaproteobacteria bacterium]|nr:MAG: diguanylate cyclase [Gammaproteobacteria bacterium]